MSWEMCTDRTGHKSEYLIQVFHTAINLSIGLKPDFVFRLNSGFKF